MHRLPTFGKNESRKKGVVEALFPLNCRPSSVFKLHKFRVFYFLFLKSMEGWAHTVRGCGSCCAAAEVSVVAHTVTQDVVLASFFCKKQKFVNDRNDVGWWFEPSLFLNMIFLESEIALTQTALAQIKIRRIVKAGMLDVCPNFNSGNQIVWESYFDFFMWIF